MTKLRHYDGDGRMRFITFSTHRRLPLLTDDPVCNILLHEIAKARERNRFALFAYVILPEHVQLVLLPRENFAVGHIIGDIKRYSAPPILQHLQKRGHPLFSQLQVRRSGQLRNVLWMRRCYDHNCRTPETVRQRIEYCHQNPVKRGLVESAVSWQWSSFNSYQEESDVPMILDVEPLRSD